MALSARIAEITNNPTLSDQDIVQRVRGGDPALFEVLMRRHNQRVYRAVRAILRDEAEVEETMQQAYLSAYVHLGQFNGASKFSTWLTRIAINEALGRLRRATPLRALEPSEEAMDMASALNSNPEEQVGQRELVTLLQTAVDRLPEVYRSVLMLRQVEGLSTLETAEALSVTEDVVKVRLFRARALLRKSLMQRVEDASGQAFPFHLSRCDRVVQGVMANLNSGETPSSK
jgi:RNA polymerase sigma-70 factor, ECF subfamily